MKRKSFTLIEILIALIILSILASLSVAVYQKTVDANNERICAQNLKVLQAAIDIYTVENDALPLALAQLTPRQIYLASCRVIGERRENHLSIALRKMFSAEPALANGGPSLSPVGTPGIEDTEFERKYLKGALKAFGDPADKNSPGTDCDGIGSCGSYNFNLNPLDSNIFDNTTKRLNNSPTNNTALVQDSNLTRHGKGTYGLGITPAGRVGKVTTPNYVNP